MTVEPAMTSRELTLWLDDYLEGTNPSAGEILTNIEESSWLADRDRHARTEALTEAASSDLVHLMEDWSAEQRHQNPDFILGYETAIKDANWLVRRVLRDMASR